MLWQNLQTMWIELIKNTEQPEILNVRMIRDTNDTKNEDNDGDDSSSNSSEQN